MKDGDRMVRKTIRLRQDVLDRARRILGTRSDDETIDQALDLVVFRREVLDGVRRIAGTNSIRDVFAETEDTRRPAPAPGG